MSYFRYYILAVLIPFFLKSAIAQEATIPKKRFPVKNISYESGLLDNNVNSIATDGGGFTWLSTFTGLQRYNGYKFITIEPVIGKDTFSINYPVYLFPRKNGNIWISINQGILEYDHFSGKFKLVISYSKTKSAQFGIVPMKECDEGIWCLRENMGVVLYDFAGNLKKKFHFLSEDVADSILRSQFILYDRIITASDSLICIDNRRNSILLINHYHQTVNTIDVAKYGILGITSSDSILYMISGKALIVKNLNSGETTIKMFDPLHDETGISNSLWMINNHTLLISRNGHLFAANANGDIQYEMTDKNYNGFVANGYIQKMYSDDLNRIWLLSNDAVERIQNSQLLFEHLLYAGEQHNFSRALYFDEKKHILISGGYNGAIQLYDSTSDPLWKQSVISKLGEYIIDIEKLSGDDYLVIAYRSGWFDFNLRTRQARRLVCASSSLEREIESFQHNYPNNLVRINDSVLLVATDNNVYRCVFYKNVLTGVRPLLKAKLQNNLDCFLPDHRGNIWLGTFDGVLYRESENSITTYQIPGDYTIRSLAENIDNNLLVGTEHGLFIYNSEGTFLNKIDKLSGLANDCIYSVLPVDEGCFVSTNLGISSIGDNGEIHNYSKEMGLQESEFNTNASLKGSNGKFYFGGVNGITAFFPENLLHVNDTALVHVTQLTVDDSSYNPSSGIWSGDSVSLNYRQNRLRFDIAAMGMLNTNEYVYQYRLKGLDTVWQTSYQPTNISYILQPGTYTLEIKCRPLLSSNQEFKKNFYILITPPFWETWWFRFLALTCLVAIVYILIHRYQRTKYLKRIRLLETRQQVQMERERISRELHDNIGSQLSLLISNIDWTIDSVENISRSEEMQRLSSINATAKNVMTNLRESIWALNKEKITLDEFADKLKSHIQNVTKMRSRPGFLSNESIKSNIAFSPTETLNIFRICQEAVNNIIKHAEATVIELSIQSGVDQSFSITIADNGKGFETSSGKGYGLENMKFRASEMNLQISIQSQKGSGTIVSIYK